MTDHHYIYTKKYRLEIQESWEDRSLKVVLMPKDDNSKVMYLAGAVPNQWTEGEGSEKKRREVKRYRELHVQLSMGPKIQFGNQEVPLILKNEISQECSRPIYSLLKRIADNRATNFGVIYWKGLGAQEKNIVLDPHNGCINLSLLERKPMRAMEAFIAATTLPNQQSFYKLFEDLQKMELRHSQGKLILGHELLYSVPVQAATPSEEEPWEKRPGKLALFRHIFLTELIVYMITHQFGRSKYKHTKHWEGYSKTEYEDQELEMLRSWGYRMYQYRDHPIKWKKKKRKQGEELDSLDEEEEEEAEERESEEEEEEKLLKEGEEGGKGGKDEKKTRIQKMGLKIKRVIYSQKNKDICNFTFISGYEKSRINEMRYCLHQLTMATDHTQAMMDFIRLVFQVVPIHKLQGTTAQNFIEQMNKKSHKEQSSRERKKGLMSTFLDHFKVKRSISSCLGEYTADNFFHRILNTGLRLFRNPYQLVYFRLPFYHVFWSIKFLYHRNKRALFQHQNKKIIRLFRGTSINDKEVKEMMKNRGAYIEVQGFLSTSLEQSASNLFVTNLQMVVHVPVANLTSVIDNGFAEISDFSHFKVEKEVLINAFNVFKVESFIKADKNQRAHKLRLQYGGLKAVEEKVRKSENVLDKEYLLKEGQRQMKLILHKLIMNKEKMSEHWNSKLMDKLKEEIKKNQESKKRLQAETKEQYEHAVTQLAQWDKELLLNSQHQLSNISYIQCYGSLLVSLDEWRKACIYLRRRVKQVEARKVIEGINWRNSQCLTLQLCFEFNSLHLCYSQIGRVQESLEYKQKLLNIFQSINIEKSEPKYYGLLYFMCAICDNMTGMKEKRKIYEEKLMQILQKYQLASTYQYKQMKQKPREMKSVIEWTLAEENRKKKGEKQTKKQEKQRLQQQKKRKQTLISMKKKLKQIRLQTQGLYTFKYLNQLYQIIYMMHLWGKWRSVIKQGSRYLVIRNHRKHVQGRIQTYRVLTMMLSQCVKRKRRQELKVMCRHITSFTRNNIYNMNEVNLVFDCISGCFSLQCQREAIQPLLKLISSNIKCKLSAQDVFSMTIYGYVLLLMRPSLIDKFMEWIGNLYQRQSLTHTSFYIIQQ